VPVIDKIRDIAERVAASEGLEVLEVEMRGGRPALLRIVIDKEAGVTHQDCETVSRQMSAILDVEDLIAHSYTLEVSSPGAERKLTREGEFARFQGHLAKVVLKAPLPAAAGRLAGQGSLRGRIVSCGNGMLTLEVAAKKGATEAVTVALGDVARANLVLEW
jgi:ribosome maturation factor RimP